MTFWILAALLSALAVVLVMGPLRKEHKWLAITLTFLVPALALALYLWGGNPDLAQ